MRRPLGTAPRSRCEGARRVPSRNPCGPAQRQADPVPARQAASAPRVSADAPTHPTHGRRRPRRSWRRSAHGWRRPRRSCAACAPAAATWSACVRRCASAAHGGGLPGGGLGTDQGPIEEPAGLSVRRAAHVPPRAPAKPAQLAHSTHTPHMSNTATAWHQQYSLQLLPSALLQDSFVSATLRSQLRSIATAFPLVRLARPTK
jgi:hypothetical protein